MSSEAVVPYRISAQELFDKTKNRKVIPLTLSADITLGGGVPLGCTVVIGGKQKLGKTTCALQYAANAQNLYGVKVFFFPIEGRLTHKVLSQIQGIKLDIDHFEIVLPPVLKDKKGNEVGHTKWSAEKWWDLIGSTINENPGSIIIVDSISQLCSEKELSEDIGYQDRGGSKKSESQFVRKYGENVVQQGVTIFLLAQIQANTSGYGAPIQAKFGNAVKHMADVILFGKSIEKWAPVNDKILGHDMIYTVEESALSAPYSEMRVPLRYGYGIDRPKDVIQQASNLDIIKVGGSWYTLPFAKVKKKDKKGVETEEIVIGSLEEPAKKGETYTIHDIKTQEQIPDAEIIKIQGENGVWQWLMLNTKQLDQLDKLVRERLF